MKQYTTLEQTTKLIELGFEEPRYECLDKTLRGIEKWNNIQSNYSICELIEMLGVHLSSIYYIGIVWAVNAEGLERRGEELIDALYAMILQLKEEG